MRKYVWLVLLMTSTAAQAQYFEAGIMAGVSNYVGDLSSNSTRLYLNETHFAASVFARYNIHNFASVKLGLSYGKLSGKDANAEDPVIRQRNLSFESPIYELALTGEFNLPGFQPYNLEQPFSAYLFGGFALMHFNPSTRYLGQKVLLQPVGTEGQGLAGRFPRYKLFDFSIPLGIGFKYAINDTWNIGLELGGRRAFTDYLDDVSTTYMAYDELLVGNGPLAAELGNRSGELLGAPPVSVPTGTPRGDNRGADLYFIGGISISYNFMDNGLVGSRGRVRRKSGCKTD